MIPVGIIFAGASGIVSIARSGIVSIVRSVLEYACPVWAALPKYLEDAIESVQKGPYASFCRIVTMTTP